MSGEFPWETPQTAAAARPHWAYREIAVLFAVAALSLFAAGRAALYWHMRASGIADEAAAAEAVKGSAWWALAVQAAAWLPVLLYIHWVVVRQCRRRFAEGVGWLWLTWTALFTLWTCRRRFAEGVGWLPSAHPARRYLWGGALLAASVIVLTAAVGVPEEPYPMLELLDDREALWALAAFGVLVAPVVEEIVFRGFLFAALERVHGSGFALAATSAAFALVHGGQYGWQWQRLAILFWVGLALGAVRARTRSTKAAALVHAAYNGLLFALVGAASPPVNSG